MDRERISKVKGFAQELGLEVWYSCTVSAEKGGNDSGLYTKQHIPVLLNDFVDVVDSVVVLEPKGDHIEFSVSKDRDTYNPPALALKLDPKTLLIQG
jgi:hypothetical protein